MAAEGDNTPIAWMQRDLRYVEKTRHSRCDHGRHHRRRRSDSRCTWGAAIFSDELTIHYGLLPRANRGIFAIKRIAGPGRQNSGRSVQYHAKKATFKLRATRCACHWMCFLVFFRESRGLHGPRKNYYSPEGPHWGRRDSHPTIPRRFERRPFPSPNRKAWTGPRFPVYCVEVA